LEKTFSEGSKQPELLPRADEAQFPELAETKQLVAAEICSEALIIFIIYEYTAILVKFEYFMVISLVSPNF
jgi:hypothetical protein